MLSNAQASVLGYLTASGWSRGTELVREKGMSGQCTRKTLMALVRRGLVVHNAYHDDMWLATPRAQRVMAGQDGRMGVGSASP